MYLNSRSPNNDSKSNPRISKPFHYVTSQVMSRDVRKVKGVNAKNKKIQISWTGSGRKWLNSFSYTCNLD